MRRAATLLVGLLLAATVLLLPQQAFAATGSHPRITTLLSSSQYIVFTQQTSTKDLRPDGFTGGSVFATDVTGQRMTLPGFGNTRARLYLTGSLVVQAQNQVHTATDTQTVRYLDLDTRRGGSVAGEPGEVLVGAGPDGWLLQRSVGSDGRYGSPQQITYVHRDGTRTDLGIPFPDGQGVGLVISDTGIVATPGVSDENRFRTKVLFQPWKSVGTSWRTLYTTKDEQVAINCAPSSTTAVACERDPEEGEGEGPYTHGLIRLDGAGATWMIDSHPKACNGIAFATVANNLVAVETSDIGVCTKGKLYRFTSGGALISGGSHHYSSTGILAGLGGANGGSSRIILSSLDQRHVDTLTGVTRAPHVLVRV